MVIILRRTHAIIASTITMALSIIFFSQAGITKNIVLMPLTTHLETYLGLNASALIASILFLSLAMAIISVYTMKSRDIDFAMITAPVVASLTIFIFLGFSFLTLLMALGFVVGTVLIEYISFNDKEQYKKISAYKISTSAASKMMLMLLLIITLCVYMELDSNPLYAQSTVDDLLKKTAGMSRENLTNIQETIIEQQKQASYTYIEGMGQIFLTTLETTGELTPQEKGKCINSFKNNLDDFNKKSKASIDEQLENGKLGYGNEEIERIVSMIEMLEKTYPILIAITIFGLLQAITAIILLPLTGIFAWALWRGAQHEDTKETTAEDTPKII